MYIPNKKHWVSTRLYRYTATNIPMVKSGVYIIKVNSIKETTGTYILYVGSSKKLKNRLYSHPILSVLKKMYGCYMKAQVFYTLTDNYLSLEKALITLISPKMNKNGKNYHFTGSQKVNNIKKLKRILGTTFTLPQA